MEAREGGCVVAGRVCVFEYVIAKNGLKLCLFFFRRRARHTHTHTHTHIHTHTCGHGCIKIKEGLLPQRHVADKIKKNSKSSLTHTQTQKIGRGRGRRRGSSSLLGFFYCLFAIKDKREERRKGNEKRRWRGDLKEPRGARTISNSNSNNNNNNNTSFFLSTTTIYLYMTCY